MRRRNNGIKGGTAPSVLQHPGKPQKGFPLYACTDLKLVTDLLLV